MKIYFFGSDFFPTGGGIATYTHDWLSSIQDKSTMRNGSLEKVTARVRIFGNKQPRTEQLGKNIYITTVRSVNFFYVGVRIFFDIISHLDYDGFHAFNLFPVGFWTVFWCFVLRKKSVVTFYGADACDKRSSRKTVILQSWLLRHATFPITISEYTRAKVAQRYALAQNSIHVIYPIFIDRKSHDLKGDDCLRKKLSLTEHDFVVVSVARLVKRKGTEYLIQAALQIADPLIKIIIIGDGKERARLEKTVKENGLEKNIFFAGKVSDVRPYYLIAHVAVLLSYEIVEEGDFEGLGLVLVEAASHGLPVVGTRSGGIPEAFEDKKTGLLIEPQDPKAIAEALLTLKNDRDMYAAMSAHAPQFLKEKFSQKNTLGVYLELVGHV